MTSLLKQLIQEMNLSESDINYTEIVNKKLQKAMKMDEVDTITFGLETDDEKIVKVYVKADKADKFEELMGLKLGQIDSIEDALNEVALEDPEMIVDVEWPDVTDESETNQTSDEFDDFNDEELIPDGSESMQDEVYDNESEENDKDLKIKQNESIGQKLKNKILVEESNKLDEKKKSVKSLAKSFSTFQQKLLYQTVLELGIPESVLSSGVNRQAVINGIKGAAESLENDSGRISLLKSFNKKSVEESINENSILLEAINKDTIKILFDKIIMLLDKDYPNPNPNGVSARLVNNTANFDNFLNRLQSSTLTRLNPASSQINMLMQKLDAIASNLEQKSKQNSQSSENIPGVKEQTEFSGYVYVEDVKSSSWKDDKTFKTLFLNNLSQEDVELMMKAISSKQVVVLNSKANKFIFRPNRGKQDGLIKQSGKDGCYAITLKDLEELKNNLSETLLTGIDLLEDLSDKKYLDSLKNLNHLEAQFKQISKYKLNNPKSLSKSQLDLLSDLTSASHMCYVCANISKNYSNEAVRLKDVSKDYLDLLHNVKSKLNSSTININGH